MEWLQGYVFIIDLSFSRVLALDEGIGTGDAAFYNKANQINGIHRKIRYACFASHSKELLKKFCKEDLYFLKEQSCMMGTWRMQ